MWERAPTPRTWAVLAGLPAVGLCFWASGLALGTSVEWSPAPRINSESTLQQMVGVADLSEVVVLGAVEEVAVAAPTGLGYGRDESLVVVNVDSVIKGASGSRLAFRTYYDPAKHRMVPGSRGSIMLPAFGRGDRCLFFLEADWNEELCCLGDVLLAKRREPEGNMAGLRPGIIEALAERSAERSPERLFVAAPLVVAGTISLVDYGASAGSSNLRARLSGVATLKGLCEADSLEFSAAGRDIPAVYKDEEVVLALCPDEGGAFRLVGGWQGKLRRLEDGAYSVGPRAFRAKNFWVRAQDAWLSELQLLKWKRPSYSIEQLLESLEEGAESGSTRPN